MLRNELAAKDQELNMLKSGLEKERNNLQQQLQEKSSSLAGLLLFHCRNFYTYTCIKRGVSACCRGGDRFESQPNNVL